MGSFTAVELARRGLSVVGFDQFTPPHGRGSHSGASRIFRTAYVEGDGYVQLAQRAGELWDKASEQFGVKLLHRTGVLYMGHPDGTFIRSVQDSAGSNGLAIDTFSAREVHRRYPAFAIPDDHAGVFDPQAGWIDVDASIQSALTQAAALGVDCRLDRKVVAWESAGDHVRVQLENETVTAQSLIVTAGAWAEKMLRDLHLSLKVRRKVIAWFDSGEDEKFDADRIPVFAFAENFTYGFPNMPGMGLKMAVHYGGVDLSDADSAVAAPDASDLDPIREIAARYMPGLASAPLRRATTCLYTLTSDEHFIVDLHPHYSNVVLAAGFSGHGFKFAPVIAIALADLVQHGQTSLPIGFLSLDRFAAKPGP
jgi:monomeric sarcosine oxidase